MPERHKTCPECGASNRADFKRCKKCGARMPSVEWIKAEEKRQRLAAAKKAREAKRAS